MAVRDYKGAAPHTTLATSITNSATSFSVAAGGGTGYPTGSGGNFVVALDTGLTSEEKILCSARAGDVFTVASGGRGWDDTAAAAHNNGAGVDHVGTATDLREANAHVNDTTGDPHPQYLTPAEADAAYLLKSNMRMVESYVDPNQATTSTTYVDLATYGPALDVVAPASGVLRIAWSLGTTPGADTALATAAVFGPSPTFPVVRAANDADAIQSAANGTTQREFLQTGLTPGTTYRIVVMYRSQGGGSVAFFRRRLVVTPSA